MSGTAKERHDELLKVKPEGASHDAVSCPYCPDSGEGANGNVQRGGSMSQTYTDDDVKAKVADAVAAATAELKTKLSELEGSQAQSEKDAAIAEAKAELQAQIDEIQAKLDAKEVELTTARDEKSHLEKFWADAVAEAETVAAAAARKGERVEQLTTAGLFDEKYISENADRFAAMSDEDFTARMEEWKALKPETKTDEGKPESSLLTAARVSSTSGEGKSSLGLLRQFREEHVDPRTIRV